MYHKLKKERVMTKEEAIAIYLAVGGRITYCPPGNAKNAKGKKNTSTRSKKCLTYNTTSAPGLRSMNWESSYNTPTPYNGVKIIMG